MPSKSKLRYNGTDYDICGDELATKANIDGYYNEMTVGNAEQLVSNVRVNDKTPYIFRTSGGSVDIGDREYVNGIVGGTIAWNQLAKCTNPRVNDSTLASITSHTESSMVVQFNGGANWGIAFYTEANIPFIVGHKYFFGLDYTQSASTQRLAVVLGDVNGAGAPAITPNLSSTAKQSLATIVNCGTARTSANIFIQSLSNDVTITMENVMAIDLTQLFGSTIADYIYSLEQANAGAGVAWFKKLFPKPYYEYNAGELKSVSGLVSHDMTGFNQWDEEWEVGKYNLNTGAKETATGRIRSKNAIPVISGATYYAKSPNDLLGFFYDADMSYIGYEIDLTANATFAVPSNACYLAFGLPSAYGATYNHDICVNLAWDNSRNGEYEPYELHSYPLDSDLTLRGIPKLDANNNLYYDGDVYEPDGTVTRKYGIVDLGSLTWTKMTTQDVVYYNSETISDMANWQTTLVATDFIPARYSPIGASISVIGSVDRGIVHYQKYIAIRDTSYSDATSLTASLNGVYLVYELATPTTETADPYQTPQIVSDFGTEEFVIDTDIAVPIPVGHDTDYPLNLVAKLEMAPNSPDGDGMYVVKQTSGMNEYVPLIIPSGIPSVPTTDGTYKLTATVSNGTTTLSWEA